MITQMPKEKREKSKRNAPRASCNRSGAARPLPGYEWCWCRGFNISCGSIRAWKTCQLHALKERKIRNESQAHLLVDFLADSIKEFNVEDVEDRWDTPGQPQDKEGPVDKVDLEPGRRQQHGARMHSYDNNISMFDFNDTYPVSPPTEPGPSHVSCARQAFKVEPDSEND